MGGGGFNISRNVNMIKQKFWLELRAEGLQQKMQGEGCRLELKKKNKGRSPGVYRLKFKHDYGR